MRKLRFTLFGFIAAALCFCGLASPACASAVIQVTPAHADAQEPLVVWVSGDGGWGKMERQVTRRLAARGAPTLGLDSLRYFAVKRSPEAAARRIAREVRAYEARHGARPIVFAGFSFGANIGPFIVHDLPKDVRSQIRLAAFLSPAKRDNLEVSPLSWLGIGTGPRVWPALSTLAPTPVLCIGGAGVFSDICPDHSLSPLFTSVQLEGGHILKDQYDVIAALLLSESLAAP